MENLISMELKVLVTIISMVWAYLFYLMKRRDSKLDKIEENIAKLTLELEDKADKGSGITRGDLEQVLQKEFLEFENRLLKKGYKL